jgi:hypothetical protein
MLLISSNIILKRMLTIIMLLYRLVLKDCKDLKEIKVQSDSKGNKVIRVMKVTLVQMEIK